MFKFINKIKNKEYSKEKGFSLLELSVAVGIAAIVGAVGIVATTGFIGSAEDKRDNYVANAERAIADAESSSLALGETGSTGGTNNSSGEKETEAEETPAAPSVPATVLASDIISTEATLTWSEPETGEVGEYIITLNGDVQGTEPIPNNVFSYEFTELTVNTYYEAKVFAKSPAGTLSQAATTTFISELKPMVAAGGDKVYDIVQNGIEYRVHEFTAVGESSFVVADAGETGEVEYLVVAGGGGGGGVRGGGGGGGGAVEGLLAISNQTYSVSVGNGGSAASANASTDGGNGGSSVFDTYTAFGGGGGGSELSSGKNSTASAGGGGTGSGGVGGSGGSQGNDGGDGGGTASSNVGGGGGGVTTAGENGRAPTGTSAFGGKGGEGLSSLITGSRQVYGSGGGGSAHTNSSGGNTIVGLGGTNAGDGGVTRGGSLIIRQTDGITAFGGGGGAAPQDSSIRSGSGGSGIVIVRYPVGIVN